MTDSCSCHLLRETCDYCNEQYAREEGGDFAIYRDSAGNEVRLTGQSLMEYNSAKLREMDNRRLAEHLDHNCRTVEKVFFSDPDGPPHHIFTNKIRKDIEDEIDTNDARFNAKLTRAHRIPFAWNWSSIRDDLRMGTMALFGQGLPPSESNNP